VHVQMEHFRTSMTIAQRRIAEHLHLSATGTPGTPMKVATPANSRYDAFLRLTMSGSDGANASNPEFRS
jgi:hypothetical protein